MVWAEVTQSTASRGSRGSRGGAGQPRGRLASKQPPAPLTAATAARRPRTWLRQEPGAEDGSFRKYLWRSQYTRVSVRWERAGGPPRRRDAALPGLFPRPPTPDPARLGSPQSLSVLILSFFRHVCPVLRPSSLHQNYLCRGERQELQSPQASTQSMSGLPSAGDWGVSLLFPRGRQAVLGRDAGPERGGGWRAGLRPPSGTVVTCKHPAGQADAQGVWL